MPSDDLPLDALQKQLEMEGLHASPVSDLAVRIASWIPFGWPFEKLSISVKEYLGADAAHKLAVLADTVRAEVRRLDDRINRFEARLSELEKRHRAEVELDLLTDATRKALNTRSIERVQRIGVILANGIVQPRIDADEVEEMMRIAMDVTAEDVEYLRELVKLEGQIVTGRGRIPRYDGHRAWEQGPWGTRIDPKLDSVFSKLAGFGLVAPIPPPNNLNVMADFQNRFLLLPKGVRFVDLANRNR